MKGMGLKLLLYFLRSLIYAKRGVFYLFGGLLFVGGKAHKLYRKTIGFYLYKAFFIFKVRVLKKLNISRGVGLIDFLGQRWVLQAVIFLVAVVIMVPQSRLYTKDMEKIPGQETLLYKLVGPGDQNYDIEELGVITPDLDNGVTHTWREGAVLLESPGIISDQPVEAQEIAGISAGGGAINKPTILPGSELPVGSDTKRSAIVYHEVQAGEVVGEIAQKYKLNVLTVLWANNLTSRSYIRPGDKLIILPVDGVLHKVAKGDNVSKIAKLYSADTNDIVKFNKLQESGEDIVVGEQLLVPNGKKPQPTYTYSNYGSTLGSVAAPPPSIVAPAGSLYIWPTTVRRITQYYSLRHGGLDVGGSVGTPLYAARSGLVVRSQCGWNGGYGCYVIIDHGGGVHTLYGHASRLYVSAGEQVAQGQTIALMGSTGRSTGSHLHFEVRVGSQRRNPLQYIR